MRPVEALVIPERQMTRNIIRWFLLLGLIALGLLYLNSSFFSAWVAGGPPNDYPHAWAQRALIHFGFSISLIASAIMAFIALKVGFKWKDSRYKYIWLLILLLSLGYPKAREWVLIDKCLDSGGAWNSQHFECNRTSTFDNLLSEWEQGINDQLKKGRSGIYGNPVLVQEIGSQAHLHEDILFQKLRSNMFAYELLDASKQLLTKYNMAPFKGGSVQDQQQKWLDAYQKRK